MGCSLFPVGAVDSKVAAGAARVGFGQAVSAFW
jgi:hypothetical protein